MPVRSHAQTGVPALQPDAVLLSQMSAARPSLSGLQQPSLPDAGPRSVDREGRPAWLLRMQGPNRGKSWPSCQRTVMLLTWLTPLHVL